MESGHTKFEEKVIQQERVRRIMKSLQSVWTSIRRRGREEFLLLSGDERRQLLLSLLNQYQNEIDYKTLPFMLLPCSILSAVLLIVNPLLGFPCLAALLILTGSSLKSWHKLEMAGNNLLALSHDNLDVTLVPALLDFARRRRGRQGSYRNRIEILGVYLRRLLPQVTPETAEQWTLDQRESLSDILSAPFVDFDLTVAVLKVIAFAGACSALPRVRFLAALPNYRVTSILGKSRKANQKNAHWIREAAQACLPLLAQRYSRQEAPETLLRSSRQFSDDDSMNLLRIADGRLLTDQKELLRPQELERKETASQVNTMPNQHDAVSTDRRVETVEQVRIGSER